MKTIVLILTLAIWALCCLNYSKAQDTLTKQKVYKTWVSLNSSPFNKVKGVLYNLKDSSISIAKFDRKMDCYFDESQITDIAISDIKWIKFRKKNSLRNGTLIGIGFGMIVGGIYLASESYKDPSMTPVEGALFGAWLFSLPGAIVGSFIGSLQIKIPINGSIDIYKKEKNKLRKYLVKNTY